MYKKFMNNGGQNPIEAAKLNCKIYHGPFVYNFQEVYEILEKNRVSKKVNDYEELSDNLSRDLEAPKKINSELSSPIKNLEQKTLTDTMKIIDNFLYNDVN